MRFYKLFFAIILSSFSLQLYADGTQGITAGNTEYFDSANSVGNTIIWRVSGYDAQNENVVKVTIRNFHVTNLFPNKYFKIGFYVDQIGGATKSIRCLTTVNKPPRTIECELDLETVDRRDKTAPLRFYVFGGWHEFKYDIRFDFEDATAPQARGDVVARDLDIKVAGNTLGHVGIWTGNQVLEVSNIRPVVRQISFANFKSTKYWGARYGKGTSVQAIKAIDAGWRQRKYNPTYTFFAGATTEGGVSEMKWVPVIGGSGFFGRTVTWVKKQVLSEAKFRCDTFVRFSYAKAGVSLGSPSLISSISPSIVYNAMPRQR